MDKFEHTTSADIVKDNIEALKTLFPEAFTEGKIDFEVLKQMLGGDVEEREEKYGLNWYGKRLARQIALTPSTGTLRPCPGEGVDENTTKNIMIEGDNLEVLKLLQKSYSGKVKLIYIDPPYNTGKDFVYPDNFKDGVKNYLELTGQVEGEARITSNPESSGRFHTDWLNMMYPRLLLARNLLQIEGLIIVSVDDHEQVSLKNVMDEIFGEENFIGTFIINAAPNARDYGHIGKMHEYAHFYCKSAESAISNELEITDRSFKFNDKLGGFNVHPLYNSNEAFTPNNRPNLYFPIYLYPHEQIVDCNLGESKAECFFKIGFERKANSIEIFPPKSERNSIQFVWRWGRPKCEENFNDEIIGYRNESGEYRVVQKMRHTTKLIRSILDSTEFTSRRGTAEVEELLGGKICSFPKPLRLIQTFVQMGSCKDDVILDIFAGSGTTGHAVMTQNAQDNGNRNYILAQLPEPLDIEDKDQKVAADFCNSINKPHTIAELTKERLRRAGQKIKSENPMFSGDTGFRVFKLDTSNIHTWEVDKNNLDRTLEDAMVHIKKDRSEEDILIELLLKLGLDLTVPIESTSIANKKVYSVGLGALIVCLDQSIKVTEVESLALGIIEWHKNIASESESSLVFRDSAFENDIAKTNLTAILEQYGLTNIRSL